MRSAMTLLLAFLISLPAAAADTVGVHVFNNQVPPASLFVTVYDVYSNQSQVFSGTIDAQGEAWVEVKAVDHEGRLRWEARTDDRTKCGSGFTPEGVQTGDIVRVVADGPC